MLAMPGCAGSRENFRHIVHMVGVTGLGGKEWAFPTLAVTGLVLLLHLCHHRMTLSPKPL